MAVLRSVCCRSLLTFSALNTVPNRESHYLDESLNAVLDHQEGIPAKEVRRLLVNLCGSIRYLERENERLRNHMLAVAVGHVPAPASADHQQAGAAAEVQP